MSYLVNLSLEHRRAVVVGGGAVAARKVEQLLHAGALVTVVAPRVAAPIGRWAAAERLSVRRRTYRTSDLDGAFVVIAATGDSQVNARVCAAARRRGVLVNVVDEPALCTFTLPAVVRRGDLTIAVATEGRCPAFAGAVRREIAGHYGREYGRALARLARVRRELRRLGWTSARIQVALTTIYDAGLVDCVRAGDATRLRHLVASAIDAGRA